MGSVMGTQLRKALAVLVAVALALSMNPATALAAVATNIDTGEQQSRETSLFDAEGSGAAVSAETGGLDANGRMSTDVSVRVKSNFRLTVTSDDIISIDPNAPATWADEKFTVAFEDGSVPYAYELVRQIQVERDGALVFEDDATWVNSTDANKRGELEGAGSTYTLVLPLAQQPAFQPDALYRYVLTATDAAGVQLTTDFAVSTSSRYEMKTVVNAADTVSAYGLMLKNTMPGGATTLTASQVPDARMAEIQRAADGKKVDSAYELAITNDAATAQYPAYRGNVQVVIALADQSVALGTPVTLFTVGSDGALVQTDALDGVALVVSDVEIDGKTVRGVVLDRQADLGLFAIAYDVPDDQKVWVEAVVGNDASDQAGGSIDIAGRHQYPASGNLTFTFIPDVGSATDHAVLESADQQLNIPLNGQNNYVLDLSGLTDDAKLTVYFRHVDEGARVSLTTAVAQGAGTIACTNLTATRPAGFANVGDTVSVLFTPDIAEGMILDHVTVKSGLGAAQNASVINNALVITITAATTITAYFTEGTTITPQRVAVSYEQTPDASACGWTFLVPTDDAGTAEVGKPLTLTLDRVDPAAAADYQLTKLEVNGQDVTAKMLNGFTNYTIPCILGDTTIVATFGPSQMEVPISVGAHGSVRVSHSNDVTGTVFAGGTSGIISGIDRASQTVTVAITPDTGYLLDAITGVDVSNITPSTSEADGKTTYTYRIPTAALIGCTGFAVSFKEATKEPERFDVSILIATDGTGTGTVRLENGGAQISSGHTLSVVEPGGISLLVEPASGSKATVTLGSAATGVEVVPDAVNKWVSFTFDQLKALGDQKSISVCFETTENVQPTYTLTAIARPAQGATMSLLDASGAPLENGRVPQGDSAQVRIAPVEGYALSQVTITAVGDSVLPDIVLAPGDAGLALVDGAYVLALSAEQIEAGYRSIVADLNADTYSVNVVVVSDRNLTPVTDDSLGTVSPLSATNIPQGGSMSINVSPANGYAAYVKQQSAVANGTWSDALVRSTFTIMNITADTTVYVLFEADANAPVIPTVKHYITVQSSVGGIVEPAGSLMDGAMKVEVSDGASMPFTFIPTDAERFAFSYVTIDEGTPDERSFSASDLASTNGQYVFGRVVADHTLHAYFAPIDQMEANTRYDIFFEGEGTVSPTGPLFVPKDGSVVKTVEVAPAAGQKIGTIVLNGQQIYPAAQAGAFSGDSSGGTITLPATLPAGVAQGSLQITFVAYDDYEVVHASVSGEAGAQGGRISPAGDVRVGLGKQQTFSFIPDADSKLASVQVRTSQSGAAQDVTSQVIAGADGTMRFTYTLTVTTETWIVAAFAPLDEGEAPEVPDTVKVRTSVVGGSASPASFDTVKGSTPTITLMPDASDNYVLTSVSVNGQVISPVPSDGSLTLTSQQTQTDVMVRATFEVRKAQTVEVDFVAGPGGSISPAGKTTLAIGARQPISLIPDTTANKKVVAIELTYADQANGYPRTERIDWTDASYVIESVSADLVEVKAVFGDVDVSGGDPVPEVETRTVEVSVVDAALGSVSPMGTQVVTDTGALGITLMPAPGYTIDYVRLITSAGERDLPVNDMQAFVPFDKLGDGANSVQVAFKPIVSDFVDVEVTVSFEANVGKGGTVDPSGTQRVGYGQSREYYIYPLAGYVVGKLEYCFTGESQRHALQYSGAGQDASAGVNDIQRARTVRAVAEDAQAASGQAASEGVRYYTFELRNITSDVEVYVTFRKLADGEPDTAKVQEGTALITATTQASAGGFISPTPAMRLPQGQTGTFTLAPSTGYAVQYVTVDYADGGREVFMPDDLSAEGELKLTFQQDMSIYAQFERATTLDMTTVTTTTTGSGTISPGGTFRAQVGSVQDFLFRPASGWRLDTVYVSSAETARHQVKARSDNRYTVYGIEAGQRVEAVFVQDASYVDPNAGKYVTLSATALTDGAVSTKGGTISPAGSMSKIAGSNVQQFVIEPASGYDVDSVVVQEMGKDAWTVSRDDVRAGTFTVTNINADTQVRANFVSVFYTVDISFTEGGSVQADGKAMADADQVRVLRGRTLPVVVTPHENYRVADISTSGLVFVQAQESSRESAVGYAQPQTDVASTRDAVLAPEVADPVERANDGDGAFVLRVAGPGALRVVFDGQQTAPDPEAIYCTVTTKSTGHGTISASAGQVVKGSQVQISLAPENGYYASSIIIECNGTSTTVSPVQSGYSFTVEGDTVVTANFALAVTPGPSDPALRALRQLQGLASTGDLNMPGALLLVCIACAAVGVALLSTGRSRRRLEEERKRS